MENERTLVFIKPDAIQKGLAGEIISRLEKKGLKMQAAKLMKMSAEWAARHYAEHVGKPFYDPLIRFMTSAPILAMVWEGPYAIQAVRILAGKTNGVEADPGTIRGDFSLSNRFNLIHASDGAESAAREIDLFFGGEEMLGYETLSDLRFNF